MTVHIDLNAMVPRLATTWNELAQEEMEVEPGLDLGAAPVRIGGTIRTSSRRRREPAVQRDATFEMPACEKARLSGAKPARSPAQRRQALIDAAGWKGNIVLRTRRLAKEAVLEVADSIRHDRRSAAPLHRSTSPPSRAPLFAGLTAGMGLGLSFVMVILDHRQARLEIESRPLEACFACGFHGGIECRLLLPRLRGVFLQGLTPPSSPGASGLDECHEVTSLPCCWLCVLALAATWPTTGGYEREPRWLEAFDKENRYLDKPLRALHVHVRPRTRSPNRGSPPGRCFCALPHKTEPSVPEKAAC
ncbi:MAG: hypothetical protein U0793_06265 [Gemmataceae bacterium]